MILWHFRDKDPTFEGKLICLSDEKKANDLIATGDFIDARDVDSLNLPRVISGKEYSQKIKKAPKKSPKKSPKKGRYQRKDMRATDENNPKD